jgi:hypothetical protein
MVSLEVLGRSGTLSEDHSTSNPSGSYCLRASSNPWWISYRTDPEARVIADRHYNRQKPGTKGFVPPGRCLVLKIPGEAFWVTSYPFAQYVKHAWAGSWVCSAFRNEGTRLSSELILHALACTRWAARTWENWDEPEGMVTFVNTKKVNSRNPGFCYKKAGFKNVGFTKAGLVALYMHSVDMPEPEPPLGL